MELNRISGQIVGAALEVHSRLGPGLLESAYATCLAYELRLRGLHVEQDVTLPIHYKAVRLENVYRMDLLVERAVVVELKAVAKLHPVHSAQLLSYLRLSNLRLGLLLNFHEVHLKDGIKRVANNV